MHKYMAYIFWSTLVLYIVTLCTVSYVGVHLTYVAVPVIIVSGLLMKLFKPKVTVTKSEKVIKGVLGGLGEALELTAAAAKDYRIQTGKLSQS